MKFVPKVQIDGRRGRSSIRQSAQRGNRWQRYRARLKVGRKCAQVEYDAATLDLLISMHCLAEEDAADSRRVGVAIERCLAETADWLRTRRR